MNTAFALFAQSAAGGRLAVRAVVLTGPFSGGSLCLTRAGETAGTLGAAYLDAVATPCLRHALDTQQSVRLTLPLETGPVDLFLDVTSPPPRLIAVGAVHTSIALVDFANALGFHTIVLDARSAFATPERFAHAAELARRLARRHPPDAESRRKQLPRRPDP